MPVMDGYQATTELRQRNALGAIPVIAMTADVMEGDRERATQAGMVDHIAKPLNVGQMFATLAKWIAPKAAVVEVGASPAEQGNRPATQLPTVSGLNTAKGLATVMGNRSLYARQLERFYRNYQDFGGVFARALADPDASAAKRVAHNLRGIAGNLGAVAVQAAAEQLEQACKAGAPGDSLDALLQKTLDALQPVLEGLKDFAPQESAVVVATTHVDSERLHNLLEQLATQLTHGDTDASETIAELVALVAGTEMQADLKRIARAIEEFDFEAAEQVLQTLLGQGRS